MPKLSIIYYLICLISIKVSKLCSQNQLNKLDSIITLWEKYGVPENHKKDYFEYTNWKKKANATNKNALNELNLTKDASSDVCSNLGFESANFTNWNRRFGVCTSQGTIVPNTFYTSFNDITNGNILLSFNSSIFSPYDFALHHQGVQPDSISGIGYDFYSFNGNYHTLKQTANNNSSYSARINNAIKNKKARRLEYDYTVPAKNPFFIYDYSIVFSDGNHLDGEQAAFSIMVLDEYGNSLNIPNNPYSVNVNNAISNPDFIMSAYLDTLEYVPFMSANIYYKPWTKDTINLCQFIGKKLHIVFEAMDCIYGAHFCYAYVDANCNFENPLIQNISCFNTTNFGLQAPIGYVNYQWYNPSGQAISGSQTGNSPFLNLSTYLDSCKNSNCIFNVGDVFTVDVLNSNGCVYTLTASVTSAPVNLTSINITNTCPYIPGGQISVQAGGGSNNNYQYYWYGQNCSGALLSNTTSLSDLNAGSYCLHITNGNCPSFDTIIQINNIPTSVYSENITIPECIDSIYQFQSLKNGTNYHWYKNNQIQTNDTTSVIIINPLEYQSIYTLVYINIFGCVDSIIYNLKYNNSSLYIAEYCPNDIKARLISPSSSNNEFYQWNVNINDTITVISINDTLIVDKSKIEQYYVLYNNSGCMKIAFPFQHRYPENVFSPISLTNVFTPNADNSNEIFYPFYDERYTHVDIENQTQDYELLVYNRWGTLIFKSNNYSNGWNGKIQNGNEASDGVYFWISNFKSNCSDNAKLNTYKGFVHLVR